MQSLCSVLFLTFLFIFEANAQSVKVIDLIKTNLSDTILGTRTLIMPGSFNGQKALLKLFPGKFYDLGERAYVNKLISWQCKSCKANVFTDSNEDGAHAFPYTEGVATRLINVLDYKDAGGRQYKVVSFNHSVYDPDGLQTSRFTGGLLGLAKFNRTDTGWRLQAFQPAIGAYGAFSQCPSPELLQIGEDQFAFLLKETNGGAGGPYSTHSYLIAGEAGAYRQIMSSYHTGRMGDERRQCSWQSDCTVASSSKKYFRDILIVLKGTYYADDLDGLPEELKGKVSGKETGSFIITRVYEHKSKTGYVEKLPSVVKLPNKI